MKTIVLAYNDTDDSDRALERTAELAEALRREGRRHERRPRPRRRRAATGPGLELQVAQTRLGELGIEAELVEAYGEISEAIVEVAESHGADLIVVGTRELSHVERMLGYSVSEGVQRMARCDVLIVH